MLYKVIKNDDSVSFICLQPVFLDANTYCSGPAQLSWMQTHTVAGPVQLSWTAFLQPCTSALSQISRCHFLTSPHIAGRGSRSRLEGTSKGRLQGCQGRGQGCASQSLSWPALLLCLPVQQTCSAAWRAKLFSMLDCCRVQSLALCYIQLVFSLAHQVADELLLSSVGLLPCTTSDRLAFAVVQAHTRTPRATSENLLLT